MPKLKRGVGWNFPTNDDGQENGLNDPGIETFKDHPLSSLAREVLQNSSDAADGSTRPVQVHFERLDIPASEFPGYPDFKKTLQACADYWKGSPSTERFIKSALAVLSRPSLTILKISDFNTTGLVVGAKAFYVRNKVRDLAKYMVQIGGVTIIDALDEPDLRELVSQKIEQLAPA